MAFERSPLSVLSGAVRIADAAAAASAQNNVAGAAATLYHVEVDNRNGPAKVYLKLYNHAAPTIGTTAPDTVIPAAAGKRVRMKILGGGVAFATALSYACVTTPGTAGTTSPTIAVPIKLVAAV